MNKLLFLSFDFQKEEKISKKAFMTSENEYLTSFITTNLFFLRPVLILIY